MTEEEKRMHRCCFAGQRPEKLTAPEAEVRSWLSGQIDAAIHNGFTTFITGMAMGVDIWAGETVVEKRVSNPALRLIAATPYPTFSSRWKDDWRKRYDDLWHAADWRVEIAEGYHAGVFQQRNEWMVNHSSLLIAYTNGEPGGTKNTIDYAKKKQVPVIAAGTDFSFLTLPAYVAFDLETTGLSAVSDRIIEIGAVKVVNDRVVDRFSTLVYSDSNPSQTINHISVSELASAPELHAVLPDFLTFCEKMPLIAHNAPFDMSFLRQACKSINKRCPGTSYDTLQAAVQLLPDSRHSLGALADMACYVNKTPHRALGDAEAVKAIVEYLRSLLPEDPMRSSVEDSGKGGL